MIRFPLLLCTSFLMILFLGKCTQLTKPKAVYKPINLDFGKKSSKDTIDVVFIVENLGQQDLIIEKTASDCECTVSSYTKAPIKFNKRGEIKVRYIPKSTDSGKVFKELIVTTNSVKKLQVLTITGIISE